MREKQSPKQSQKQPQQIIQEERRKYKRINKNFILTYYEKIKPKERYEVTQMKNISLGGMCFITTQAYPPSTLIAVELKTPYLADSTYLEGVVLESHEKVTDIIYETRLQFTHLNADARFLIHKLIEFFISGKDHDHE